MATCLRRARPCQFLTARVGPRQLEALADGVPDRPGSMAFLTEQAFQEIGTRATFLRDIPFLRAAPRAAIHDWTKVQLFVWGRITTLQARVLGALFA